MDRIRAHAADRLMPRLHEELERTGYDDSARLQRVGDGVEVHCGGESIRCSAETLLGVLTSLEDGYHYEVHDPEADRDLLELLRRYAGMGG